MSLKIKCSCTDQLFETPQAWARHYNDGKPQDARGRIAWAQSHVTDLVNPAPYVSPNSDNAVQRVNAPEAMGTMEQLRVIHRRMEALHGEMMLLQEREESLLRSLEPVPVKATPDWVRTDIKVTCRDCGRGTYYRFRGIYKCQGGCRSTESRKVSVEHMNLLEQMMADAIGDSNDPENES